MSPAFTADDVGKTVESADGKPLGVIVSVEPETAYVEPEPGVTDSIKAVLDWGSESEGAVPLTDDAVDEVAAETIRLEAAFPEESITSGETDESDQSGDRSADSNEREIGYAPGEPVSSTSTEAETGIDGTEGGPGTSELDDAEPMIDDERYDDVESGPRVDPDEEMSEPDPDSESVPDTDRNTDRTDSADVPDDADAMDSVEAEASRGIEVDPTELTDRDPDAEIDPDEDVGQRTDAAIDPEMDMERTDATVDPEADMERTDADVDPSSIDDTRTGTGASDEDGTRADPEDETTEERGRTDDQDSDEN